jgi:uncharacterized protein (DUF1778 family)
MATQTHSDTRGKLERLEARLTVAQKRLLRRAARIEGRSVTDFVVNAAREAAERTIRQKELIVLSARDREVFVDAILNPPAPNARLREAVKRYRKRSA